MATVPHYRSRTRPRSIAVIELEHGLHRAHTAEQARNRREYLDTVFSAIPVEPFTGDMAQLAAKIDAEARKLGRTIPLADLGGSPFFGPRVRDRAPGTRLAKPIGRRESARLYFGRRQSGGL